MNKLKINQDIVSNYKFIKIVGIIHPNDKINSKEALELAQSADLDLVCMNDELDIPICKIYNYSKEVFDKKKRVKDNRKKSKPLKTKTVQLSLNMSDNDKSYRIDNAVKFLLKNNKVKITLLLKGSRSKDVDKQKGLLLLNEFVDKINSEINIKYESKPTFVEGKTGLWQTIIIKSNK